MFEHTEYEEGSRYYCHKDKSERPLCGSIAMNEDFDENIPIETKEDFEKGRKLCDKNLKKWDVWANSREVSSRGICKNYDKEKDGVNEKRV